MLFMKPIVHYSSIILMSAALAACGSASVNKRDDAGNSTNQGNNPNPVAAKPASIEGVELIARYQAGTFGESAAEITDYHKASKRAFVINAEAAKISVLDLSNLPQQAITGKDGFVLNNLKDNATSLKLPAKIKHDNGTEFTVGAINSLSIVGDLMAVAVENKDPQADGAILFYKLDASGTATKLHAVKAGAMPDMVKITPDGKFALSANEGEPNKKYTTDPEGSVTLVKINNGVPEKTSQQLNFHSVSIPEEVIIKAGIKKSAANPSAELAKDLEPEYIAVSEDSKKAWVSLQENNALAIIDLTASSPKIDKVVSLGFKDHGQNVNKLDANADDKKGELKAHQGLYGIYMPDTVDAYTVNGKHYVVSANEGDGREYGDYENESKVKKIDLAASLKGLKDEISSLKIQSELGKNSDGKYEKLYAFGARSFSIWGEDGQQVYDSGSIIEKEVLKASPKFFNTTSTKLKVDDRSDNKGPEPEAIEVAKIGSSHFVFVGLERQGGFMTFDVSNPSDVKFINYIHNRDFEAKVSKKGKYEDASKAGDLAPESIKFIPAKYSSINQPLLIVANEVSGSTSVYKINTK